LATLYSLLTTHNLKLEACSSKLEAQSPKLEARSPKLEVGSQKPEARSQKTVACNLEPGAWNLKPGTSNQKQATKSSKLEARSPKPEVRSRKSEDRSQKPVACNFEPGTWNLKPETRNQKQATKSSKLTAHSSRLLLKYNQCSTLSPSLWGGREGLVSLLPRGTTGFGATPGAASITIISFFVSSPRDASNIAGFMRFAAHCRLALLLLVNNQSTLHQGSFVPLDKGDKTPSNRGQGVNLTGGASKSERRYVTNSN
jgi:hypothetical protein